MPRLSILGELSVSPMRRGLSLFSPWALTCLLALAWWQPNAAWAGLSNVKVEVNTASAPALEDIKGIGPSMAQRLVQARHQAHYVDWLDLITRTPGLSATRAAKLSAHGLRVNGLPFPTSTPAPTR